MRSWFIIQQRLGRFSYIQALHPLIRSESAFLPEKKRHLDRGSFNIELGNMFFLFILSELELRINIITVGHKVQNLSKKKSEVRFC